MGGWFMMFLPGPAEERHRKTGLRRPVVSCYRGSRLHLQPALLGVVVMEVVGRREHVVETLGHRGHRCKRCLCLADRSFAAQEMEDGVVQKTIG